MATTTRPDPYAVAASRTSSGRATAALFMGAGFDRVVIEPVSAPFLFPGDGSEAAARVLSAGPLGAAFLAASDSQRADVIGAIVAALERHRGAEGITVPAASWCITARRP